MEPGQKLALLDRVERRYPDDEKMLHLLRELREAAEAEAAGKKAAPGAQAARRARTSNAATGRAKPFNVNGPAGSTSTSASTSA